MRSKKEKENRQGSSGSQSRILGLAESPAPEELLERGTFSGPTQDFGISLTSSLDDLCAHSESQEERVVVWAQPRRNEAFRVKARGERTQEVSSESGNNTYRQRWEGGEASVSQQRCWAGGRTRGGRDFLPSEVMRTAATTLS